MLRLIISTLFLSLSQNQHFDAPLDRASRPRLPVPANTWTGERQCSNRCGEAVVCRGSRADIYECRTRGIWRIQMYISRTVPACDYKADEIKVGIMQTCIGQDYAQPSAGNGTVWWTEVCGSARICTFYRAKPLAGLLENSCRIWAGIQIAEAAAQKPAH